jgi:hypothetical protein
MEADNEDLPGVLPIGAGRIGFAVSLLQNEEKADTIFRDSRGRLEFYRKIIVAFSLCREI